MLNRNWYNSIWEKAITILYSFIPYTFITLCLFSASLLFAQPKTNLELFYEMVDSSVTEFSDELTGSHNKIKLELSLGEIYSVFNNRIIAKANSFKTKIMKDGKENTPSVNYVIDEVKVEYGETFRDGLLGDFLIPRNLHLKGNYLITSDTTFANTFSYSLNDTIRFDEVAYVENESYPFTKGELPAEPFLSGLLEPIVALSTTALAVILFFTIRSK